MTHKSLNQRETNKKKGLNIFQGLAMRLADDIRSCTPLHWAAEI